MSSLKEEKELERFIKIIGWLGALAEAKTSNGIPIIFEGIKRLQ